MSLLVLPEVAAALAAGRPVVALETTLICHGIPRPRNRALAIAIEAAVRAGGAVPATVAVLDGRLRAGLTRDELVALADRTDVMKASTADLALALATRRCAATTVASTIFTASLAGIAVMATGGLGGVHRGAETTMDVSADLRELARSRVAIVCSGAKSILDLPRTMEALETHGVTIVGLDTDELPAFYSRSSGLRIQPVQGIAGVAAVVGRQIELGWPSAVVVAVPPPEDLALAPDEADRLVAAALAAARAAGIRGKDETPFLLAHMAKATDGRTTELNEALVLRNAAVAAALAVELATRPNSP
jgi:pseudouridine-5'-phosphate glycosidase